MFVSLICPFLFRFFSMFSKAFLISGISKIAMASFLFYALSQKVFSKMVHKFLKASALFKIIYIELSSIALLLLKSVPSLLVVLLHRHLFLQRYPDNEPLATLLFHRHVLHRVRRRVHHVQICLSCPKSS